MALCEINLNTPRKHESTPAARGYILGEISEGRKPKRQFARGKPHSVDQADRDPILIEKNVDANVEISNETIRKILKKHYIFHWISKKRPFLTKQTAKVRLDWARVHVSWTEEQWKNIMWSDECSVERGSGKKPVWICRTPAQKWEKDFITEHKTGKEISVMHNGYSAGSYVEVLEDQLPEYYKPGMKFMQDNARIHTAKATKEFLEEHGIETIEWPPYSPDMNPIEHAWIHLKRLVYRVCPDIEYGPKNQTVREDLEYALQEAWLHISDELFDSLGRTTPIDAFAPLATSRPSTASDSSIEFPSTKSSASTPRDSGIKLPISPPLSSDTVIVASNDVPEPVSSILQELRRRKEGAWVEEGWVAWNKRRLSREHYTALLYQLDEDEDLKGYVENKIRYDYDWEEQYITIRMPTTLHEEFIAAVVRRIEAGLAALSASHPQLRELDKVHSRGSPNIVFNHNEDFETGPNKRSSNNPDGVFRHKQAPYPSVILEVAYSQRPKDLPKLAYRYISGSKGHVKAVVGLDLEYASPKQLTKTKEATVSVWRLGFVKEEGRRLQDAVQVVRSEVRMCNVVFKFLIIKPIFAQAFRSAGGEHVEGSLILNIADFLPLPFLRNLPASDQDRSIRLSFADLTTDLNEAEEAHRLCRRQLEDVEPVFAEPFRKRKPTPDEELSDGRETKYQALEVAEERNASQDDSDFPSPPRAATSTRPVPQRRRSTRTSQLR
ncbi:hypothetical protein B0A49_12853 [Cryomyces minteri]|uniref:Tc1-like transposase DDE domain-containing protein n=1 Tax=Cryomyces minteri TaxID=331657 RepID=A0A4U0VW84_9PEZI|nr:hypothetical protein B0A49_12853 [Cryomyces minteri]